MPVCFNGVGGQVSATLPFDEVPAVGDLHELGRVTQGFKRLVLQLGPDIKTTHATVVCHNGQNPIRLRMDFLDSHWSRPLMGNGFLPSTAKFQSASKSS